MEIKYDKNREIEMIILDIDDVENFKYLKSSTIDKIRSILCENCMESVIAKIPGVTYEIFSNGRIEKLNENESAFMRFSQKLDVKSLYPSIKIPRETKLNLTNTRLLIENRNKPRNNVGKIKVFLPPDLMRNNLILCNGKKFKHLLLFLYNTNDLWCENCLNSTSCRSILITKTDEPGYSYKPINFIMSDLSDEEFDEFLKIFNLQGSCTSKIDIQ